MTREKAIDWLCRLKSEIKIFMPYQWQKPFEEALDMAIKALEQEPRKGYLSIDDVMSVFDDFMCGEVDEDGTETFLEMLKDKAESEG